VSVRGFILVAVALLQCACQNMPETYAPPIQRQPLEEFRPYHATRIVKMSDPDAELYIAKDIPGGAAEGSWRWTGRRPTIKLRPKSNEGLKYVIDFAIPEVTLKETGPVTLTFFVNDHVVGSMRCEKDGNQHFEKAVPAEWVPTGQDALVGAEIDKVWIAPADKAQLGFLLISLGLTP
jgi:hypothetical protein